MLLTPTVTLLNQGAVWSPLRLPGLAAWYDASDSATVLTSVGPDVPASDGQTVRRWLDKSGNARHLDQTTLANQPVFTDAATGLTFSAAQGLSSAAFALPKPITIFAVSSSNIVTGRGDIFVHGSASSAVGRVFHYWENNSAKDIFVQRVTGNDNQRITGQVPGRVEILTSKVLNSSGAGTATIRSSAGGTATEIATGSGGAGSTLTSPINMAGVVLITSGSFANREVIVCAADLSASDVLRTQQFLARKHGVTL